MTIYRFLTRNLLLFLALWLSACAGFDSVKFSSNHISRDYNIHLPMGYASENRYPLMLVLHGDPSTAWQTQIYTGMDEVADKNKFIVVYPNALNKRWVSPEKVEIEIEYIKKVLTDVEKRYNVDDKKIYFVGLSGGGFFLTPLAQAIPEKMAAMVLVAATRMRFSRPGSNISNIESSPQQKPIPLLFIMGTADSLYKGDMRRNITSAEDTVRFWRQVNQCFKEPKTYAIPPTNDSNPTSVKVLKYQSDIGKDVVFYKIENGGHHWPNSRFNANYFVRAMGGDLGPLNMDFDTNQTIWDFVSQHSLDASR